MAIEPMEIRDVIHGSIEIEPSESPVIESRYFQRLRHIKQLGFGEYSYPSATHNRYIHSLGAMKTATEAFDTIFASTSTATASQLPAAPHKRFRSLLRLAALLHDIGHGPLSHTTEFAMPNVKELLLPSFVPSSTQNRKATHEDYTLKIILDSSLTPILEKAGRASGFQPIHIAALIEPAIEVPDDFFLEALHSTTSHHLGHLGPKINFKPILHQIISSELDADRMDYLRRDSLHTGVSYGQFDFSWLLGNLTFHLKDGKCYLALQHRALYAFEDFLISRFHMFLMVYFHHKSLIYDELLAQYLSHEECGYALPSDIEKYCEYDDAHLFSQISKSSNPWAQRIAQRAPYQVLMELHSGIPATRIARLEQEKLLKEVQKNLQKQNIHYLISTSTGELSKYFRRPGDPIFVRYDNHYSAPTFIPLEQCTDLFQKYGEKRSITRLYVSPEDYPRCQGQGRGTPLRFEETTEEPQLGLG